MPELTLDQAIATSPAWVQTWVMWIQIVLFASLATFLIWRATWKDAAILVVANIAMFATMIWLYSQVGFVRLLGLPHIIFWVPLVVYFVMRLRSGVMPTIPRIATLFLLSTLVISLAFDFADVARWLMGERASMLPT